MLLQPFQSTRFAIDFETFEVVHQIGVAGRCHPLIHELRGLFGFGLFGIEVGEPILNCSRKEVLAFLMIKRL